MAKVLVGATDKLSASQVTPAGHIFDMLGINDLFRNENS